MGSEGVDQPTSRGIHVIVTELSTMSSIGPHMHFLTVASVAMYKYFFIPIVGVLLFTFVWIRSYQLFFHLTYIRSISTLGWRILLQVIRLLTLESILIISANFYSIILKLYAKTGIARMLIALTLFFAFKHVLNISIILFSFIHSMIDTIHFLIYWTSLGFIVFFFYNACIYI